MPFRMLPWMAANGGGYHPGSGVGILPHPDEPPVGEGKSQSDFRTSPAGKRPVRVRPETVSMGGTVAEVHLAGTGARKNDSPAIGRPRGEMDRRDPSDCLGARTAAVFLPSPDMSAMRATSVNASWAGTSLSLGMG